MSERLDLDRLRDLVEGRLSPQEQAVLLARVRADPALAAALEDVRDVLDAGVEPVPACDLPFEALGLSEAPAPAASLSRWIPWAAAAAVFAALGAWTLLRDAPPSADVGPVVVRAIALDATVPARDPRTPEGDREGLGAAPGTLPRAALEYAPVGAGGLRFVEGVESGRALARATGRPLLVFVYHPTCPLCEQLGRTTFRDPSLVDTVDAFVLAKADVTADGGPLASAHQVGWPVFVVYGVDGAEKRAFGGTPDAATLKDALHGAVGELTAPVAWATVRTVARALREAEIGRDGAERAAALARAAAAAKGTSLEGVVRAAARAASARAAAAIREARAAAQAGRLAEATRRLDDAIAEEDGTPIGADLAAVRARLARTGRFPAVEEAR